VAKWRETPTTPWRDLASALADLAAKQEPPDREFEAALGDRSALYDYSEALQEISTIGQEMERQRAREEAIVRAALERAAKEVDRYLGCEGIEGAVLALASNPAEVAKIIKAAGGKHELG